MVSVLKNRLLLLGSIFVRRESYLHKACTLTIVICCRSSVREPAQVFTLLETVYSKFDYLAKRRRVFKASIDTEIPCSPVPTFLGLLTVSLPRKILDAAG